MGICQSVSMNAGVADDMVDPSTFFGECMIETGEKGEFILMKRHSGCSGMFWRSDPSKPQPKKQQCQQQQKQQQKDDDAEWAILDDFILDDPTNWPRDYAIIRGSVVTIYNGKEKSKWLKAYKVKQRKQKHPKKEQQRDNITNNKTKDFYYTEWMNAPIGAFLPFEYDNHYYLVKK